MNMLTFQVHITHTGETKPGAGDTQLIDILDREFDTLDNAKAFLRSIYGEKLNARRKTRTFYDDEDGTHEDGFCLSYWNRDISHNSRSWWQTDWVSVNEVRRTTVLLHGII